MAVMLVRHTVADFASWKKVFDEMHDTRVSHGFTGHEVLQEAGNPNSVMIINHAKSAEGCIAYGQSPNLKSAMQRAGVTSAPEIVLFEESEAVSY